MMRWRTLALMVLVAGLIGVGEGVREAPLPSPGGAGGGGILPNGHAVVSEACPDPAGSPCFTSIQAALDYVHATAPGEVHRFISIRPGHYTENWICNPPGGEVLLDSPDGETFLIGMAADTPVHHHTPLTGHPFHSAVQLHLADDDVTNSAAVTLYGGCHLVNVGVYGPMDTDDDDLIDDGDVLVRTVNGGQFVRNVTISLSVLDARNRLIDMTGAFADFLETIITFENVRAEVTCLASVADPENAAIYINHTGAVNPLFETRNFFMLQTFGCGTDYAAVRYATASNPVRWYSTDDVIFKCSAACVDINPEKANAFTIESEWQATATAASAKLFNLTGAGALSGSFEISLGHLRIVDDWNNWTDSSWRTFFPTNGTVSASGTGVPAKVCFPGWTYRRRDDPGSAGSAFYICEPDAAGTTDPGAWVAK